MTDMEKNLRLDCEAFAWDYDPYGWTDACKETDETIDEAIERNTQEGTLTNRLEWLEEITASEYEDEENKTKALELACRCRKLINNRA